MTAIDLIRAERERQIEQEGWTAEHDADAFHRDGELAWAAMYYAMPSDLAVDYENCDEVNPTIQPIDFYPANWSQKWAKRDSKTRIRQLVVAGALIAAEIDRLKALEGE